MNNKFKNKIFILFLLLLPFSLIASSKYEEIYTSYIWKSLIHYNNSNSNIYDSSFLLSYNNFSLENELLLTIKSFEEGKYICKYPARYLFLSKEISNNNFKKFECPEFSQYLNEISEDSLDLVFSAENVSSPSSMMGHVFFKINGKKKNYNPENAVSFFTVIDTINIPLLILKSTVLGMKGLFILNPYKQQIYKYLYEENRSIYEYKLNLNKTEKELILYHFWELKDLDMKYYFTGFNCATMINDILALTRKDYKSDFSLWLTPKDVIKNAKNNDLIKNFKMIPSIEWELHMLLESLKKERINEMIISIDSMNLDEIRKYSLDSLNKRFIEVYSQYELINNNLGINEFKLLNSYLTKENPYELDLTNYKNPLNTFNDSQFSLTKELKEDIYNFKFLPTSNTLLDDNRQYFSESSLKIAEIDIKIKKNDINISSINLYEMKLLLPWNKITKNFSKYFKFSYEDYLNENNRKFNIIGGSGISLKLHNDILGYSMVNIGSNFDSDEIRFLSSFENGIIIYELFNMKSYLKHELIYSSNNNDYSNIFTFNQSYFDSKKKYRLDFNLKKFDNDDEKYLLGFTYFF